MINLRYPGLSFFSGTSTILFPSCTVYLLHFMFALFKLGNFSFVKLIELCFGFGVVSR
ncbi:hypothetical protein C5167_040709 [Papaver somniferum]|uniref:Uncharacterized protein n=1 Tax=Papaver somniferum TaxID=3469 RepID=A0A4Y7IJ78_PAPSO|nr:hypothetical protein C5167_040709 [Papaver somniferum]